MHVAIILAIRSYMHNRGGSMQTEFLKGVHNLNHRAID